jgi:branched-chain amino acid transport system permease protein
VTRFVDILANGLADGCIYALIALGLVLLQMTTGVINFAQGDLMTLGCAFAFVLLVRSGIGQVGTFVLVIVMMFLVGIGIERVGYFPLRNRPPISIMISTFALGLGIEAIITLWLGSNPLSVPGPFGGRVVHILGGSVSEQDVYAVIITAIVFVLLFGLLHATPMGRQVRALAADREAALLQGIRVRSLSSLMFGLSAALAGLAGLLIGPLLTLTPTLGFGLLLNTFAAVVLGGMDRLGGVALAALGVAVAAALAAGYISANYVNAYPYIILLIALIVRPQGLIRSVSGARY